MTDSDFHLGYNSADKERLHEKGQFTDFQTEAQAVFKRIADDIYPTIWAGVREPVSNAITAVLRAAKEDKISHDDAIVKVTYDNTSGGSMLRIRDNGVGMTRDDIRDVLAVVGHSKNRNHQDVSGMFGIGFLALYKLTGIDGGFMMHTRSRANPKDSTKGVWTSGGLSIDSENELEFGFDSTDTYGTLLEIPLVEDISGTEIHEWLDENMKYSRVPILFQEIGRDGSLRRDDEIGGDKTLPSKRSPFSVVIDNEYFEATATPQSLTKSEHILLDTAIQVSNEDEYSFQCSNTGEIKPSRWNISLRLKTELSTILTGEHKGKHVVSDDVYANLEDEQNRYVPKSRVKDKLRTPSPVGNREKLEQNDLFWNYLTEKLREKLHSDVDSLATTLKSVNGRLDKLSSNKQDQFSLLCNEHGVLTAHRLSHSTAKNKRRINRMFDCYGATNIETKDVAERICASKTSVLVIKQEPGRTWGQIPIERRKVKDIAHDPDDVFIFHDENIQKATAVCKARENPILIEVDNKNESRTLNSVYGWHQLKDIPDELELSQDTKRQYEERTLSWNDCVTEDNEPRTNSVTNRETQQGTTDNSGTGTDTEGTDTDTSSDDVYTPSLNTAITRKTRKETDTTRNIIEDHPELLINRTVVFVPDYQHKSLDELSKQTNNVVFATGDEDRRLNTADLSYLEDIADEILSFTEFKSQASNTPVGTVSTLDNYLDKYTENIVSDDNLVTLADFDGVILSIPKSDIETINRTDTLEHLAHFVGKCINQDVTADNFAMIVDGEYGIKQSHFVSERTNQTEVTIEDIDKDPSVVALREALENRLSDEMIGMITTNLIDNGISEEKSLICQLLNSDKEISDVSHRIPDGFARSQ